MSSGLGHRSLEDGYRAAGGRRNTVKEYPVRQEEPSWPLPGMTSKVALPLADRDEDGACGLQTGSSEMHGKIQGQHPLGHPFWLLARP